MSDSEGLSPGPAPGQREPHRWDLDAPEATSQGVIGRARLVVPRAALLAVLLSVAILADREKPPAGCGLSTMARWPRSSTSSKRRRRPLARSATAST